MTKYINETYDQERALYGITNAIVEKCVFDGPADGESALKETSNLEIKDCKFMLRYPMWHLTNADISDCLLTDSCRAGLWYDAELYIHNCRLNGIKALRECSKVKLENCNVDSTEFGWFCQNIDIKGCTLKSEYPFLRSSDIKIENLDMTGKYSFQYTQNVTINNSVLNTKDAFWHSKNTTVINSTVKGEYLGWYSENLRFINCKIIGTQPLCYAKGLVLENCQLLEADLAFENSEVTADIKSNIISIKNPISGSIVCDGVDEIIHDEYENKNANCIITIRDTQVAL